jgi:hypothetical protein
LKSQGRQHTLPILKGGTMNFKTALVALSIISSVTAAQAEVRTFVFTGTVNWSTPMAPAGSVVKGTFSYNTAQKPDNGFGDLKGHGYSSQNYIVERSFKVEVNGHTLVSSSFHVDVVNNFGGNIEDSFNVYGLPMTLDSTQFADGSSFGIFLASGPGKTQVLHNTSLPREVRVQRYDGMNYGWAQVDGSSNGGILSFVIDKVVDARSDDCDKD